VNKGILGEMDRILRYRAAVYPNSTYWFWSVKIQDPGDLTVVDMIMSFGVWVLL